MLPVESLEQTTMPRGLGNKSMKVDIQVRSLRACSYILRNISFTNQKITNPILLLDRHTLSEVTLNFYPASSRVRHLNE